MAERKVFTSQKISILAAGKEFQIQALISPQGAKHVFVETELPTELRANLGKELELRYKNIPAAGRLMQEKTVAGTMYNLKFINPSKILSKQIARDLSESGLPSPWRRALPRLSTTSKHLPMPSLVVLFHAGETIFLTVRNFTLGGILCEYLGNEMRGLSLGSKFTFDLVTNSGDKIADVTGVLCHISEEIIEEQGGISRMHFGLRFLPMGILAETKYRHLIREHCEGLQAEHVEELKA